MYIIRYIWLCSFYHILSEALGEGVVGNILCAKPCTPMQFVRHTKPCKFRLLITHQFWSAMFASVTSARNMLLHVNLRDDTVWIRQILMNVHYSWLTPLSTNCSGLLYFLRVLTSTLWNVTWIRASMQSADRFGRPKTSTAGAFLDTAGHSACCRCAISNHARLFPSSEAWKPKFSAGF